MEDGVAAASPFRQGFSLQHWGAEFKEGTMGTCDPNDWIFFSSFVLLKLGALSSIDFG